MARMTSTPPGRGFKEAPTGRLFDRPAPPKFALFPLSLYDGLCWVKNVVIGPDAIEVVVAFAGGNRMKHILCHEQSQNG